MKTLTALIVSLFVAFLLTSPSLAQVFCSPMATSLYCSGPSSSTTITELSPGRGVITDSKGHLEPYAVVPAPQARPIEPLKPLPDLQPRSLEPPRLGPPLVGPPPLGSPSWDVGR